MKPNSPLFECFSFERFSFNRLLSGLSSNLMAGLLALCAIWPPLADAQIRTFPEKTKVGMLQMGNFPEAQLDGKRIIFAPGVRIMNVNNTTVLPMTIQQPVRIRYRLDSLSQVDLVWILSEEEARAAEK